MRSRVEDGAQRMKSLICTSLTWCEVPARKLLTSIPEIDRLIVGFQYFAKSSVAHRSLRRPPSGAPRPMPILPRTPEESFCLAEPNERNPLKMKAPADFETRVTGI